MTIRRSFESFFGTRSRDKVRKPRTKAEKRALLLEPLERRELLYGIPAGADPIFAPGTDPQYMADFLEGLHDSHVPEDASGFQFADNARWSSTATDGGGLQQGDPTTLTWSITPDGSTLDSGTSDFVAFMDGIYGGGAGPLSNRPWFPVLSAAFDRWSEVSGVTYVYEPNDDGAPFAAGTTGSIGVRGDVRLGGKALDGTSGVLAYNYFPNYGEMVFDTTDNFYTDTSGNSLGLRNVTAHEAGHGLGFSHNCPIDQTKLMEPFVSGLFDGPQHDDILAAHRGYGDPLEPNDSSGLGSVLSDVGTQLDLLSIDGSSDVDYFAFTAGARPVSIDLAPFGLSYLNGPQNSDGSCSAGTTLDTLRQNDLTLEVLGSNGQTVIATANAGGPGVIESITDLALNPGNYFLRVSGDRDAVQQYSLNVSGTAAPGGSNADPPQLISISPNDGDIFNFDNDPDANPGLDNVLDVAPRDLTLRFDGNSEIDEATLDGIRITQSGFDGSFRDDFNTNGAVEVEITQLDPLQAGLTVVVTKTGALSGPALPTVTVSGTTITVDLNTDPGNESTAGDFVEALQSSSAASALVKVLVAAGDPRQDIATPADPTTEISPNIVVTPGFIGFGDSERVVVARFAETLRDDLYRIEIFGIDDANAGIFGLRDTSQVLFEPTIEGTDRDTVFFELDLGAQINAIVPQPVSRTQEVRLTGAPTGGTFRLTFNGQRTGPIPFNASAMTLQEDILDNLPNVNPEDVRVTKVSSSPHTWNVVFQGRYAGEQVATMTADPSGLTGGANPNVLVAATSLLDQARDQVIVYFNDDDLLDDATSAENPDFYQLIFTNDTARNTGGLNAADEDDVNTHTPTSVAYYPELDKAVLTFADDIDKLSAPGTYRLRVGTDESAPLAPTRLTVAADAVTPTLGRPGSSFATALDIGALTVQSQIIESSIDAQQFVLDFAGSNDEAGHRDIPNPPENHLHGGPDGSAAITTQAYNFQDVYGVDSFGNVLHNAINEAQKERTREILALYANYLGIEFVETAASGWTVATGDLTAVGLVSGPGGVAGVAGGGRLVMDAQDFTNPADDRPFAAWFQVAMHEIGHLLGLGHDSDLPVGTVMRGTGFGNANEPDFPGDHDIVHGQFIFRPSSKDVDLFEFNVTDVGTFTAETFAERLPDASDLDTQLRLYKELPDGTIALVSQNDDYYSEDSFIELELDPGTYYIGVSASGNDSYNPEIEDTGLGGRTDGAYDLRLNFRPSVDNNIVDATGTDFDGDLDGVPGGVYDFWFQAKPLERVLEITGDGTTFSNGQTIRVVNADGLARTFTFQTAGATVPNNGIIEFNAGFSQADITTALIDEINNAFGPMTATLAPASTNRIVLSGERSITLGTGVVGINIEGRTIFVDKTAAANADGSLSRPFNSIAKFTSINAFANTHPGDIVRIVGNGGIDGDLNTVEDAFAYEIGFSGPPNNTELSDGATMEVPRGVTTMIDSGALFKLRQARIGVGSSTASGDRSGAALQVLGTPVQQVFFNSFNNDEIGIGQVTVPTTPRAGDWGGISFREDTDRAQGRFVYEQEGIFLDYVNFADFQYGGGSVFIDSRQQIINPIHITQARPTITNNTITKSADAAISADPNSFRETNFHEPRFQMSGEFTSDYDRVGPHVRGNRLVDNSNNGLFVRIDTPTGGQILPMTVSGRFDDTDVTHIISQNLIVKGTPSGPLRVNVPPPSNLITFAPQAGGTLAAGTYQYIVTFVDIDGYDGPPSAATTSMATLADRTIAGAPGQGSIRLNNLPPVSSGFVGRRIYRSDDGGTTFTLVANIDGSATSYLDDGTTAGGLLTTPAVVDLARRDARLAIDPGTIVKLENARVETTFGAQFLAEGTEGQNIIFTTRLDDRYGAGGTFDTNNDDRLGDDEADPTLIDGGDWGGLYFGHTSLASIDHALVTYAGGVVPLEGDFAGFNAIEIQQADVRIANSVIEMNDGGRGGSAPGDRFGRLSNSAAAIFVRGAQPVILDNIIRDNDGPAISINANALNYELVKDRGRSIGPVDRVTNFSDNQGALIRRNLLSSDPSVVATRGGINGMEVRGEILTTEVVWDDTDIVHVLRNTVTIPDFHTFGGLRLESSPSESLVVKLLGASAGFTATGNELDIDDRIGGMLHIIGQPGFPVILTSLNDDSIGAGFQPDGLPQTDTNNGGLSVGSPGNWRSIQLLTRSHDRNVELALELEDTEVSAPGNNFTPNTAQFLGELAPHEKAGDDNVRLGYDIHGVINEPNDVDVYSFVGTAGTDVWFDIDRTDQTLDTVVELVDVNGQIIAQSNDSDQETLQSRAGNALEVFEANPAATDANILQKSQYFPTDFQGDPKDHGTLNPRDAGFRIALPGTAGSIGTYFIRVRSSNVANATPQTAIDSPDLQDPAKLFDGITSGSYELQIRIHEVDENPGSTVRYADIRYATTGIDVRGLPRHSALLGESGENVPDNNDTNPQYLGNLLGSERAALSVNGNLSADNDLDRFDVDVSYLSVQVTGASPPFFSSATFDVDYADGIGRPNTTLNVFQGGQLVLSSKDAEDSGSPRSGSSRSNSNLADDIPGPLSLLNMDDLTRGSAGQLDPFIGPVELPSGERYTVVVSSDSQDPVALRQFRRANVSVAEAATRVEPVNSVVRIAEDHIGESTRTTAAPPVTSPILPTAVTFDLGNAQEEAVVPFHLGDVVLFSTSGNTIRTINPFTGQVVTTLGETGRTHGDIAMRPDGELFTFSWGPGTIGNVTDGSAGNYLQIDTGTAAVTNLGDDGIQTFEDDPMNVPSDRAADDGIRFNAIDYPNRTVVQNNVDQDHTLYAYGTRFQAVNVDYSPNVLYRLTPSNGAVMPNGNNRTDPGRNFGAGTAQRERGIADTSFDPTPTGANAINAPDATTGNTFTIDDGDNIRVNLAPATDFEMDFGPQARLAVTSPNRTVRDGQIFTVTTNGGAFSQIFELNTGHVIDVTSFTNRAALEGHLLQITDNVGRLATFEFDDPAANGVAGGNVEIDLSGVNNVPALTTAIANAINTHVPYNVTATIVGGDRITLTQDSTTVVPMNVTGAPGVAFVGDHLVGAGNIEIVAEESFNSAALGVAIQGIITDFDIGGGGTLVTAGVSGNRVNFRDAHSLVLGAGPQLPPLNLVGTGIDTDTVGKVQVPLLADDNGTEVATAIAAAINGSLYGAGTAVSTGATVSLTGSTFNAALTDDTGDTPPGPFIIGGSTPGGLITGMATVGGVTYAVTGEDPLTPGLQGGGLYRVNLFNGSVDLVNTATALAGIDFEGLVAGPLNVEGGAYANMLFAIDSGGTLHAFDTGGVPQPVFVDGATTVATGASSQGLAFSTLDYNLWHTTDQRRGDDGHGIDASFDLSRGESDGFTSFYFGFDDAARNGISTASRQRNCSPSATVPAGGGKCDTYNFPGGAHGSLEANPISLKGYSAEDQPTLYFNYRLDTDNTNHLDEMRDSFRVYMGTEDGAWHLLATNNSARDPNRLDEYDDPFFGDGITVNVQELYDIGDAGAPAAWRQARISLAPFAGMENLRLRYDFATAGNMDVGDPQNTGDELRAIEAYKLRDQQTFTIDGVDVFEIEKGATLVAPSGAMIPVGQQFTVDGGGGPVTFTFTAGASNAATGEIHVDSDMTPVEVAEEIRGVINGSPALGGTVTAIRNAAAGHRVNLSGAIAANVAVPMPGFPATFVEGAFGGQVFGSNVIVIDDNMDNEAVAAQIDAALELFYSLDPAANAFKDFDHVIRVIGHSVTGQGPGPFAGQRLGLSQVPGDGTGGLWPDALSQNDESRPSDRGVDNQQEGVYIDDIIIGFAERGEMITDAPATTAFDEFFTTTSPQTLEGEYQLEVRRSALYGVSNPFPPPPQVLVRSFDTNDRISLQTSLTIPRGADIHDDQIFTLSDGLDTLTFEFDDASLPVGHPDAGVAAGHVLVPFRSTWRDDQVAESVRDVINSDQVQAVLEITAGLSDGKITGGLSTSNIVNLYGNVTANVFAEGGGNFGDPTASPAGDVTATSFGVGEHGLFGTYGGDQNHHRDQGQLLIHSNFIANSSQFGISIDSDTRNPGTVPNQGAVRNTRGINQDQLFHGVTVINNVLNGNNSGGIRFSGQSNAAGQPIAPVPFGRIVNNTIYGTATFDVGIQVDTNASPTVLNNIVANAGTGISVDASSQNANTVLGSNLFQNAPTAVGGFDRIILNSGDPLFLDAPGGNFYLESDSAAIDSALDALNDRFDFYNNIKRPLGIAESPILAPALDVVGQLRADGDSTTSGGGLNPLKDRGAFDRVDTTGPTAVLLVPRDNDTEGVDQDQPTETVVQLSEGVLSHFDILLVDDGTGPDLSTLTNLSVSLTEDGRALTEGVDYTFGFNSTSRTIRLTPLSGIWKPGRTYEITLNNRDRFVIVAPDGASVSDGDVFTIADATGSLVTYEYESGYVMSVPQTLTLELPSEGALPGGIVDGENFTISNGLQSVNFEFDSNNNVSGTNVRISFKNTDSQAVLVSAVIDAIDALAGPDPLNPIGDGVYGLDLSPRDLGDGVIHLGTRSIHSLMLSGSGILQSSGVAGGVDDEDTFTIEYGSQMVEFEFDSDSDTSGTSVPIPFTFFETYEEIADTVVGVIAGFNPMVVDPAFTLAPLDMGGGRIHLGGIVGHVLDTSGGALTQTGVPGVVGSLRLQIPASGGAGFSGIADGQTFSITNGAVTETFEFNTDGSTTPGNIVINFSDGRGAGGDPPSTQDEIAASVTSVISGVVSLGLTPTDEGNGQVRLNETARHTVDTSMTNITVSGVSGGAVPVNYIPDRSFTGDEMAGVIINTVNSSSTAAFARLRAGSTVFISDATAITGINTITSPGNPLGQLEGIKDVAGNNLQPNRANNESQFTIILAGAELDYGDAPDPFATLNGKYPTLRSSDGARHVLVPDQIFLGAGVDAETDGQPTRVADGDDADHVLDVSGTSLSAVGVGPVNLTLAAQAPASREGTVFVLNDGVNPPVTFEFDRGPAFGVGAGNVAIPFLDGDDIDTIVDSIVTVVSARLVPTASNPLVGFNPTNLGGGLLYLGGGTGHTIDLSPLGLPASSLTFTGELPARITTVGAGLAMQVPSRSKLGIVINSLSLPSAIGDGERFTIDDGINPPVIFEFEETSAGPAGVDDVNRVISFDRNTDSAADLATKVEAAIRASSAVGDLIDLDPMAVGNTVLLAAATTDTSVDTSSVMSPNLGQLNPVADGQSFTIDPDGAGGPTMPTRFEFDSGGGLIGAGVAVPVNVADSANDIADAIVATIGGLGLNPVNLGDATIDLGGTVDHEVDVTLAPNLILTGTAGGIADGQIFTIDDGVDVHRFEFDRNEEVAVGNIAVIFLPDSSPLDIAAAITSAVNDSELGMAATDPMDGTVDLATDDDDGVHFNGVINPHVVTPVNVVASGPGLLDGWIDYNQDGDWDDFGEKVFDSVALSAGANALDFTAPGFAVSGETFARFRFSVGGRTFPTGVIVNGEVEDYLVSIAPGTPPVVNHDSYSTDEDTPFMEATVGTLGLGVLSNDQDNENELLTVTEVNGEAANVGMALTLQHGGTVTVLADGTFNYDPTTSSTLNEMVFGASLTETFTYRANDIPTCGPPCETMISNNTATVSITINGRNDAPVITSNMGGDSAMISVAENTTAVTVVTATDVDRADDVDRTPDTLTYTVSGGDDASFFEIDPATHALTFKTAPDFETRQDDDMDGIYIVHVEVTDDGTPNLSDIQTLTVTVTDVNDPPVIQMPSAGDTASVTFAENQATTTVVAQVQATDQDMPPNTLTYTITPGGVDGSKFNIDSGTGELRFNESPNFELPTDSGADNVYEVEVTVADGNGGADVQLIQVNVTDIDDAPVINLPGGGVTADVDVDENETSVTTVSATGVAGTTLTYTITGGADAGQFSLDPSTGVLLFNTAPDFENPTSSSGDNNYEVAVTVNDGIGGTDSQLITVIVGDVNEAPVVTTAALVTAPENQLDAVTITASDEDTNPVNGLTYSLSGGPDVALFDIDGGTGVVTFKSAPDFENPSDIGGNNIYDFEVTVTDDGMPVEAGTKLISVEVTDTNDAPVLHNGGNTTPDMSLPTITEDQITGTGVTVAQLLLSSTVSADAVTDQDPGALEGIAITGVTGNGGTWRYSTNGGATFFNLGAVSGSTARLLRSSDLLRYVPNQENGETGASAPTITFQAWDRTSGGVGGLADATVNGLATAFSTASETATIEVTDVNDAPVLAAGDLSLPTITEDLADAVNTGARVSEILGSDGGDPITDVDNGAVEGIAVTATTGRGTWEYSTDGGASYDPVGTVAVGSALLLRESDRLRYVPDGDNGETATVQFQAWDQTDIGTNLPGSKVSVAASGGVTPYSAVTSSATILVTDLNDAPVAMDDNYATGEDQLLNVIGLGVRHNDDDVDVPPQTLAVLDPQLITFSDLGAVIVMNSNGTFSYDPRNASTLQQLPAGQTVVDRFRYRLRDNGANPSNLVSNEAVVSITVTGANDNPIANNVSGAATEDGGPSNGNFDAADRDTGETAALTYSIVSPPAEGSASTSGTPGDDQFTFDPGTDFQDLMAGQTRNVTFTYRATDPQNGQSNAAVVTVTVTGVNDRPEVQSVTVTTSEDGPTVTDLFAGTDVDGDSLTYQLGANANVVGGLCDIDLTGVNLTDNFVNNANGSFSFSPGDDFHGLAVGESCQVAIAYTANDGITDSTSAMLTATVTGVNDGPVVNDDNVSTTEDAPLTLSDGMGVLINDFDVDVSDSLAVVGFDAVSILGATVSVTAGGGFTYDPTGSSTLQALTVNSLPVADTFRVTVEDEQGARAVETVTVSVSGLNDAPVARADFGVTSEDGPLVVNPRGLLLNDVDPDTGETATLAIDPGTIQSAKSATVTIGTDGRYSYDPRGAAVLQALQQGQSTTDTFTYTVRDVNGVPSLGTVTITVNGVNDAPTAADDSATTNEDQPITISALINDSDPDTGDQLSLSGFAAQSIKGARISFIGNGQFTYDPRGADDLQALLGGENEEDTFTYTISDNLGATSTATVTVAVSGLNDAPVGMADAFATDADSQLAVSAAGVLANDTDVEGSVLTVLAVNGSAGNVGSTISLPSGAQLTMEQDGGFTYDPTSSPRMRALPAGATDTDQFIYEAFDGFDRSTQVVVSITVTGVNDAPVANADSFFTTEDQLLSVGAPGLLANDSDVDGDLINVIAFSGVTPFGASVTIGATGSFQYDPRAAQALQSLASGEVAEDEFSYTISDGNGGFSTATATVTVQGVNDAPQAVDDAYRVTEDAKLIVSGEGVIENDSDPDGDPIQVDNFDATSTLGAPVTVNPDGTLTYDPTGVPAIQAMPLGQMLFDTFTYQLTDGTTLSNRAVVTVTLDGLNDAPVVVDDTYFVEEEGRLSVSAAEGVLNNPVTGDFDPEGSPLTAEIVSFPANGNVSLNAAGGFTYTPNPDFSGVDSFSYRANDGTLRSAVAIVTINVTPVNDAPVALDDQYVVDQDSSLTVLAANGVLANDRDVDGEQLTAELVAGTGPANGTLQLAADGSFNYVPSPGFFGTDSFQYEAVDGSDTRSRATVTIEVENIHAWQNPLNRFDVNADGTVSPQDALLIINYLNNIGPGPVPEDAVGPPFRDVTGDDFVAPSDVLAIVNYLNSEFGAPAGEGEGSGSYATDLLAAEEMAPVYVLPGAGIRDRATAADDKTAAKSDSRIRLIDTLFGEATSPFAAPAKQPVISSSDAKGVQSFFDDIAIDDLASDVDQLWADDLFGFDDV